MKGMAGPFGEISMGGLVTVLKVRDQLSNYDEDPGWYKHPAGTVALKASDEDLRRDGIDIKNSAGPETERPKSTLQQNGHAGH